MGPHDSLRERNRELLAANMNWPADAVTRCRELESAHPRYTVWWSRGMLPSGQGPGFYSNPREDRYRLPQPIYAPTADGLAVLLATHEKSLPPPYPWEPH